MWLTNTESPETMDPYALQQQQQRGQQMQQMAMQPGGGGWGQVAMSLLGGIMGRRMEDRGAKGLQDYETRQREETIAKRQAFAAALTGGDVEGAIAQAFAIPGMENVGVNLLTERNKPKTVPDAILSRYTPESIAEFNKSQDYAVLKPLDASANRKGLPTGYEWGPDGQARRIEGLDDYFSRQTTKSRAGTAPTIINMPGGGQAIAPTKPTQNTAQGALVSLQNQLANMDAVADTFADEQLTAAGNIRGTLASYGDWAGVPIGDYNKQFLTQRRGFSQNVEQLFNQYRKLITGAAASQGEIERLRESFLNTSLGPTEFKASYNQLRTQISRDIDQYQTILQSGIPVQEAQALFSVTPFGEQVDVSGLPTSDAALGKAELQGQLSEIRGAAPNASQSQGIPRVTSDADFDALPRGATFIDPEGNQRVKP